MSVQSSLRSAGGDQPACLTSTTSATERPALLFREARPDAGVLPGRHGPLQTGALDRAVRAYPLGRRDLRSRGAGGADGEEKFRILVLAASAVYPVQKAPPFIPQSRTSPKESRSNSPSPPRRPSVFTGVHTTPSRAKGGLY